MMLVLRNRKRVGQATILWEVEAGVTGQQVADSSNAQC